MTTRSIIIHAFASVKGGVGKSTLSVALAKHLAAAGGTPILLDCDMLGTSLADGLNLRAPAEALRMDASTEAQSEVVPELLSLDDTRQLRLARRDARAMGRAYPVYLNDLLDAEAAVRWSDGAWRHENDDGVRYFPSASIYQDVVASWGWLYKNPFDWVCKLAWLLDDMIDELPTLTDVVLDLPPGIVGFSHEIFVMLSFLSVGKPFPEGYPPWPRPDVRLTASPFIVMTSDRNDLLPAYELWGRHLERLPTLTLLLNRGTEGRAAALEAARDILGALPAAAGMQEALQVVTYQDALARVFKVGDMPIASAALAARQTRGTEVVQ